MLLKAITVILPLLAAASAASTTSSSTTTNSAKYYLQAQPLGKNPKTIPNNYLSSYHSGAGQNIVTLVPRSDAPTAYLTPSGGYQEFDLGTTYPWGFVMGGESDTAGASLVGIDAGKGDGGFSLPNDEAGLVCVTPQTPKGSSPPPCSYRCRCNFSTLTANKPTDTVPMTMQRTVAHIATR